VALLIDFGSPTYWLWQPHLLTVAPYVLTVAALLIDCGTLLTDCGSPMYWLWQPHLLTVAPNFTLIMNFTLACCISCMQSICKSTVVTTRATYSDVKKLCALPTNSIHVLCTILRINDNYFPEQYWPVILCIGNGKCLHWGRNLIYNLYYNYINFRHQKISEIDSWSGWNCCVGCSVATVSFSIIYVKYTMLHAQHYRHMHRKCLKNIKMLQKGKVWVFIQNPQYAQHTALL
jgi:hypothetical protein